MERTQWYLGAPNAVVLCVDGRPRRELCGRLYHSYSPEAMAFGSIDAMTRWMQRLYDFLNFPHPATNSRHFAAVSPESAEELSGERNKIMSDESLLNRHGDLGTFIVRVQHRQNSSWQGRITWMEEDRTINFRSVWEMVRLIEDALDTVSTPEEGEGDPSWFEAEK